MNSVKKSPVKRTVTRVARRSPPKKITTKRSATLTSKANKNVIINGQIFAVVDEPAPMVTAEASPVPVTNDEAKLFPMSSSPVPGLPREGSYRCRDNVRAVYKYNDGMLRPYPNPDIAKSWDSDWAFSPVVNCDGIPRGEPMPMNTMVSFPVSSLQQNRSYRCRDNVQAVYRYQDGMLNHYPNPDIARSWDSAWITSPVVNCDGIPRGQPMSMNTTVSNPVGYT